MAQALTERLAERHITIYSAQRGLSACLVGNATTLVETAEDVRRWLDGDGAEAIVHAARRIGRAAS